MSQSPITAIDHLSIGVANLEAAAADYAALLGCGPRWQGEIDDTPTAVFFAGNLWLCLVQRESPNGLERVCFSVDSAGRMLRRLDRTGIALERPAGVDPLAGLAASCEEAAVHCLCAPSVRGLQLAFVERRATSGIPEEREPSAHVSGLDHLVITSGDGTATGFLLGAQLGLDMRMDMRRPEWGARLMFFRCGDLIIEVMQRLDVAQEAATGAGEAGAAEEELEGGGRDTFYGLSWRVRDLAATHKQLQDSGFELSPLRKGRKPGTEVCSVRSRTAGVATLLLQPA